MNITKENLVKLLEACTYEQQLKKVVLQDASDQIDDNATYLQEVMEYGCVSGIVSDLVYYPETASFYDKHYDEIEALREDLESDLGGPLQIKGDLKTFFAWLAYEETARAIMDELEDM